MLRNGFVIALLLAVSSHAFPAHGTESSPSPVDFLVIVNAQNPIESLDRKTLADIFLKKITRWSEEDVVIQPVDQRPDAPVRRRFSEGVMNRSVMGIKNYWQQLIFSGRNVPPPEVKSDSDVIQYVAKNSGSIGYVSNLAEASGVKAVVVK